jgi:hypothetical protein
MSTEPAHPGLPIDLRVEVEPIVPGEPHGPRLSPRRLLVAVLVVASVAGLAGWVALRPDGAGPTPSTTAPTSTSVDQRVDEALRIVGVEPEFATVLPGVWWGPVLPQPVEHAFGSTPAPFPAGEYLLHAACVGDGLVTFGWSTATTTGHLTVSCDADGADDTGRILMPDPGEIRLLVADLDDRAAGRTAFAVTVTDPRRIVAAAALDTSGGLIALSAAITRSEQQSVSVTAEVPGTYRLTVVCVGSGMLMAVLALGEAIREVLTCDADGARVELELVTTVPGALTATIENLTVLPGAALYLAVVERLA